MWQWNDWGCDRYFKPQMHCNGANYSVDEECDHCTAKFYNVRGKSCQEMCEAKEGMYCVRSFGDQHHCDRHHEVGCEYVWTDRDETICQCDGAHHAKPHHEAADGKKKHAAACLKILDQSSKCSGDPLEEHRRGLCQHCGCCKTQKCVKIDAMLAKEINAMSCPAHILKEMGVAAVTK